MLNQHYLVQKKELKSSEKVYLNAGASTDIEFTISVEALKYYNDIKHSWVAEKSDFIAYIAKHFEIHPQQISDWKREFVKGSSKIFTTKSPDDQAEHREKMLYEKIGH